MNLGYLENSLDGGLVRVRIYYDANFTPVGDTQPLINGPLGFCLEVINTSGHNARVDYTVNGVTNSVTVQQGNPVTTGAGRSRTVAVLNTAGAFTRGDVRDFQIANA